MGSTFVPNDVELGGGRAPFIILTGPNMGGERLLPTLRLSMAPDAAFRKAHGKGCTKLAEPMLPYFRFEGLSIHVLTWKATLLKAKACVTLR